MTTSAPRALRGWVAGRSLLVVGRLAYAFLTGGALVAALQRTGTAGNVGIYTYQAGLGTALAIVLSFGLDRMSARRLAASEMLPGYPGIVLRVRLVQALIVAGVGLVAGVLTDDLLIVMATSAFVVSRLFYADYEALWIASKSGDATLGVALILNGTVTAASVYLGSPVGAGLMTIGSAAGNLVALTVLAAMRRLPISSEQLDPIRQEAQGFGLSAVVGVVYARVDLLILAVIGVPLKTVAVYGIVTRLYDAFALVRGAVAQQETRELASVPEENRRPLIAHLSRNAAAGACAAALAGIGAIAIVQRAEPGSLPLSTVTVLLLGAAGLPLFYSHLATTALVFADRRTNLLLRGSLIACAASVATKAFFIAVAGINGAAIALGAVELVSCVVFATLYLGPTRRSAVFAVAWPPMVGVALCAMAVVGALAGTGT